MMKTPRWLTSAAALFALPTVYAVENRNRAVTVRNILKREPEITVHDIPEENVNEFLHLLIDEDDGEDLMMELIFRSKESPKHNDIATLLSDVVPDVFVKGIAELCTDFVVGPQIGALDVNTKNSRGETLLIRAVK